MLGYTAFGARCHLVANADICKRAAHHNFVIAAARSVGVEIKRLDLVRAQIFAGRTVCLDRTGRRNMVCGDAVAKQSQNARIRHRRNVSRLGA